MIRVVLLGTGNMAHHLYDAFSSTETVQVVQVVGRNIEALKHFENTSSDFGSIAQADIYIIAVNDLSISTVSQELTKINGLIVHTSGSVPLDGLKPNKNIGIFYPLQTFSKARKVDFWTVPICIEANSQENLNLLATLAKTISHRLYEINSEQRKTIHLAAVFANNFTNHLYDIAHEICVAHQVPFEILKPLILETAQKVQSHSPGSMQTGPARRNDTETIAKHLEQLGNQKQKEIYTLLSESIKENYGEKL